MTQFTRRHLLTAAATATAASALAPLAAHSPAYGAAPQIGKQVPGWYRYKVGDFEVTAVTDGWRPTKLPDNFIRNAPRDAWGPGLAALGMDKENPAFPFTPFVVNTGSKLVVVDTGESRATYEQSKGALGQFHTNLAAAGIDRNAVDTVIISHFHRDHISGLLGPDDKVAFPNAEVMVPAAEWKYWMDDANMNSAPEGILKATHANVRRVFPALSNKVTQYEPGKELVPGITSVATPGHSPGHTSFVISSGPATVMAQVDVVAGPALLFVRNPDYQPAFDFDGAQAVQTRRKILDQIATDRMLTQGFHLPFPSVGYIEKDGNGYRFVPLPWNPTI